jgi:DNA-binding SARP family transcriptional activator
MQFSLLGPLIARRDGLAVPALATKQRVVLAALLLSAGRVVPLDELAEAVWGFTPPRSARATLQNYIKRLRLALADTDHSRISTHPDGYQITVSAEEFDVTRFEASLDRARQAARQDEWHKTAILLREGLALWRGRPLIDVPSELLQVRHAARLTEIHAQAVEARIDADLHLGRHRAVVAELQQLAAEQPLNERLHGMLMLALYRDGRHAEALTTYQQARKILIRELGVEPGTDLRDLHRRILTADPVLAEPAHRQGKRGAEAIVPRQLPAVAPHFVGRRQELRELSQLLDQAAGKMHTVVISTIGGTAGVGKTALAIHWAHRVAAWFPDGQLYVNLRGFDDGRPLAPGEAVRGFLDALDVPAERIPPSLDAQVGLYRSLLVGKQVLIVLDNARDANQVRPLLPGTSTAVAVVTSRDQLTSLIAVEGAHPLTLDLLTEGEARELLARRLGDRRVAAEPRAVEEIITRCARLPLALTITAAHAAQSGFSLATLAAELARTDRRLDALYAGDTVKARWAWRSPDPAQH